MDINLRQLRMLREVASRGTMAAAAESLGFTPSAVSQQLAVLERSTGVDVLERVGRNVRLTDAGRELVEHADVLLAELERAQVALERVGTEPRGIVRMSVYESVASTLLPPLIQAVRANWPDVALRSRQIEPDDAHDALQHGDIDIAFDNDYPHWALPTPPGLVRTSIARDWFRLVVHHDDPLDGVVNLAETAERAFVMSPSSLLCGRCVTAACRNAGFEPDVHHEVDEYPAVLRLVAGGAGIALVPGLGLASVPPGVRVLELAHPVSRTVQLTYRESSAQRPAIVKVVEAVKAIARDMDLDVID